MTGEHSRLPGSANPEVVMQPFLPTIFSAGVLALMCGTLKMTMVVGLPQLTLVVMIVSLLAMAAVNYLGHRQNPIFAS